MYMVVLPFIGVAVLSWSRGIISRAATLLLIFATTAMSVSAGTTKADMSIVVGAIILMYAYLLKAVGARLHLPVILLCIASSVAVLIWIDGISLFHAFFDEADPHGAREHLYGSSLNVIAASPLFGHGPGPHVLHSGSYWDVHQTHLSILLQAGIVGLVIYFVFLTKILVRIWTSPPFIAAFAAIFVYSAGGDILRRLPVWILLLLIFHSLDSDLVRKRKAGVGTFFARPNRSAA
jgi:O-antigen ligase